MMGEQRMPFISTLERQYLLHHPHRQNDEIQPRRMDSEVGGKLSCQADWVVISITKPRWRSVTNSVAQASILGPVLFNKNLMKLKKMKSQVNTILACFFLIFPLLLILWFIVHSILLNIIPVLLLHFPRLL